MSAVRGVGSLYGAAFTMSIGLSVLWTAMPFIIRNIGGTEEHVGYAWAANMLGYMVCLLLAGVTMGEHNPKNATLVSTAVNFISTLVMCILVYVILSKDYIGNPILIWSIIAAGVVAGASLALYWPYLMSWVSEDLEGADLNRRFGAYNCTWSGAAVVGPLIGGILVETGTPYPAVFAVVCLVICFVFLSMATGSSINTILFDDTVTRPVAGCKDKAALIRFRWIARVALFSSWACLGVIRSQFALLFTDMGYSEVWFGVLVMIFGLFNFIVLTAAGRFAFWHFKAALLPAVNVLLIVSLMLTIFGRSLGLFILSFIIMGCGFGFAYSSHLYYGACGTKKRSVQMIIHEATISIGIAVGSGAGGYIAKNIGRYQPYWFAMSLVTVGLVVQIILMLIGRLKRNIA